jgi:hypothetical protein
VTFCSCASSSTTTNLCVIPPLSQLAVIGLVFERDDGPDGLTPLPVLTRVALDWLKPIRLRENAGVHLSLPRHRETGVPSPSHLSVRCSRSESLEQHQPATPSDDSLVVGTHWVQLDPGGVDTGNLRFP